MAPAGGVFVTLWALTLVNDAYVISVLIFIIKTYIVGTHLDYLNKFIYKCILCCGYSFELP